MINELETKYISKQIFEKLNDFEGISINDIILENTSGISNNIYKVSFLTDRSEIQTKFLLFRWFGKISYLVNRELEIKIINGLSKLGLGPSIIDTDYSTYRIEEFIVGSRNIKNEELLQENIMQQIFCSFMKYYEIDDNHYYSQISLKYENKEILSTALLNDELPNIFNFSKKLRDMAHNSYISFLKDFNNDKNFWIENGEYDAIFKKVEKIDHILCNSLKELIQCLPELPILVLSHNDAHPGNILIKENKVFLIDHEYACYNYLGFEVANFLLESIFTLDWHEFPFFKQFESFEIFKSDKFFNIYLNFINSYFDIYEDSLRSNGINVDKLKNEYSEKNTYYNLIGASSIYWTLYAIFYLDYESFKTKTNFDYFNYSLNRYSAYEFFKN